MIVRSHGPDLLLITQPDHAALAARVAEAWTADGFPVRPRRATVLLAIAEHDNGWREPDRAPIVATDGCVLDFIHAPDDVRRGVWPRGVERLAGNAYAAALVAQHAIHIHDRHRHKPEWQPFFTEMITRRNAHLTRAGRTEQDLLGDYVFVRLADLLSLVFCNAWTDAQTWCNRTIRLAGDRLLVSPDPFDGREIPLAIGGRRLPDRPFASAQAARAAFDQAPEVTIIGVAAGR